MWTYEPETCVIVTSTRSQFSRAGADQWATSESKVKDHQLFDHIGAGQKRVPRDSNPNLLIRREHGYASSVLY